MGLLMVRALLGYWWGSAKCRWLRVHSPSRVYLGACYCQKVKPRGHQG